MSDDRKPTSNPADDEARLRAALPIEIHGRLRSLRLKDGRAIVVAEAGDLGAKAREELEALIEKEIGKLADVETVHVALIADRRRRMIIAVGSGKGGVGKSTLTTNLAVALARKGRKVGVIDGDVYGPSQQRLLATDRAKPVTEGDKLVPVDSPHGVKVLSMGHLVPPGKALAWRGPMAGKALGQLVDAAWGDTELLLIDLPPGTGDVQISMMADSKPDGAVLVSTPQDLALLDAARAGQLFEDGEVPIIGLVENMAGYECPHCGEVSDPFGQGGVEKFADALKIPFLGRIPLTIDTRIAGDAGKPPAAGDDEGAAPFLAVADKLDRWLTNGAI
ncbi:chromosome partitioning protein ParA [Erythrobacter sp. KY5]|uniref:Mrp/NBP35 family ATP-binding protein n=1 Tax=Erythrobacter sp. KY5 TaxID=2011159 RepID=UPI000DBF10A0|nr:Mrp/NBP35 family ATP-binding protein [Erythrobacter sp. KY5]AWW73599.1 chromosome partitioning protein ParA [Erythrobacter sp. KY5]